MASKQNPAAGQTANGASVDVQTSHLNTTDGKASPENWQRLSNVTDRIVARLVSERLEPVK